MPTLLQWYPGNRALDFFLIVVLGVALLSSAAWLVSWRLPRRPATRHLVLSSAPICCLGMPLLASVFTASGMMLIAIPLLPAQPVPSPHLDRVEPLRMPAPWQQASDNPRSAIESQPIGVRTNASTMTDRNKLKPTTALATIQRPTPASVESARPQADDSAHLPAAYRGAATLILMSWCCGTALLLLNLTRNYWLIRRLRRSSSPLRNASLQVLLDDVGRRLGVRRLPQVVVSRGVMTPFAVGLRQPIVVLPERLLGVVIGAEEMRDVLVHEVAHIRRRDHLIVLLQELARALYWPIVTVHGLIRELGQAREELCDNHVLRDRDALSYGETLLHLAELSWEARPLRASVGILHWKGALERRIAGLLDQRRSTMTGSSRGLAWFVALLFICGGTIASATRFIAAGDGPGSSPSASPQTQAARKPGPDGTPKKAAAVAKPAPAAGRSILIHVLGPDGRPMAGVNVHRSVWTRKPVNDRNVDRLTDDRGEARFTMPEGTYIFRIWARAKGYVPLFAHWEESENPEETVPSEFSFRLQRGTVIGGIVRDQDGKPIAGATFEVRLQRGGVRDGRTGPGAWLATEYDGVRPVTDTQGRWTLDNVPAGDDVEVLLKVSHPDYVSDPDWGTLQKEQGVTLAALRGRTATITMRGGLSTTGTVTDPEGKPVIGAVVVRGDHPYMEWGSQEVRTDDRGVYRLPPLPRGPLTITVVAPGWMPVQKKVDLQPGLKPVDFGLEPGKELRVRFVDRTGAPIPGVSIMVDKWRGGEALYNHRHSTVLDTQIPNQAGDTGLYQWTWAPDDAVTYQFWKEGYVTREAALVADGTEHTITLEAILRITGKVTDATTGRPIDRITAIPVLELFPGRFIVDRQHQKVFHGGTYAIEGDRTDSTHRVRIEAEGYRTAMSDAFRVGVPRATFDFRLEPAPTVRGRVVNSQGRPVAGARVYLATASERLSIPQGNEDGMSNQSVLTDGQGAFSMPAQFERYVVVAIHDDGYAEVDREPNQQPGELALRAWARVEGRLMQAGQPVASAWVFFQPVRLHLAASPQIQDMFSVQTDRSGRFVFPRVPPMKASVTSDWKAPPNTSSQSVPMDLQPGQRVEVELGGAGTSVTGRVIPSGDSSLKINLRQSLNYLIREGPGIEPPAELRWLSLRPRDGWGNALTMTLEGLAYLQTLHHYIATLDQEGRFKISGVPAGDYHFVIALYKPAEGGCLISPVGTKTVRVQVTEDAARKGTLDLGAVPVTVRPGPRPGEVVPDLAFTAFSGETVKLSDLRGRYVLLDFWAAWGPCVADLPAVRRLHDTYGAGKRLVVLGLNLDDDPDKALQFVQERKLPWTQGSLRGPPENPVLARYAVSSAPAYFLIGPDGKLIQSSQSVEEVAEAVRRALP